MFPRFFPRADILVHVTKVEEVPFSSQHLTIIKYVYMSVCLMDRIQCVSHRIYQNVLCYVTNGVHFYSVHTFLSCQKEAASPLPVLVLTSICLSEELITYVGLRSVLSRHYIVVYRNNRPFLNKRNK